jgi:hypothetical protein
MDFIIFLLLFREITSQNEEKMHLSLRKVALAAENDPQCSSLYKFLLDDEDRSITKESRRKKFRDWRSKPQ